MPERPWRLGLRRGHWVYFRVTVLSPYYGMFPIAALRRRCPVTAAPAIMMRSESPNSAALATRLPAGWGRIGRARGLGRWIACASGGKEGAPRGHVVAEGARCGAFGVPRSESE